MFAKVYGKPTNSCNNDWMRGKLLQGETQQPWVRCTATQVRLQCRLEQEVCAGTLRSTVLPFML
jgi:hypothetical protein